MKKLKIILVDDNDAFRKALRRLIDCVLDAEIIAEVSNADQFLKITGVAQADVVLMDIMMPEIDGISLTKKILWDRPQLKVIAITMHVDKVYLVSLIEAGFMGCIAKDRVCDELKPAITQVLAGIRFFPKYLLLENNH